jgi:hypothetical protein
MFPVARQVFGGCALDADAAASENNNAEARIDLRRMPPPSATDAAGAWLNLSIAACWPVPEVDAGLSGRRAHLTGPFHTQQRVDRERGVATVAEVYAVAVTGLARCPARRALMLTVADRARTAVSSGEESPEIVTLSARGTAAVVPKTIEYAVVVSRAAASALYATV